MSSLMNWSAQPELASTLRSLACLWQQRGSGLREVARVLAACVRVACSLRLQARLCSLELVRHVVARRNPSEAVFHLRHRNFLCQGLNTKQRAAAAIHHFEHEQRAYSAKYHEAVYGSDAGLQLWAETVAMTGYRLSLVANDRLRHEGPLSLVLWAGERRLCEVSFAWADSRLFGSAALGTIPFVTRNQSARADCPELVQFRKDFPNHSPVYFCMAALQGIARAGGSRGIAAIRHDAQISYLPKYKAGFENSYCALWSSYGAEPLEHHASLIEVPPRLSDLAEIKSKHRKRAQERRARWDALTHLAMDALRPYARSIEPRMKSTTISYGAVPRTQSRAALVTRAL